MVAVRGAAPHWQDALVLLIGVVAAALAVEPVAVLGAALGAAALVAVALVAALLVVAPVQRGVQTALQSVGLPRGCKRDWASSLEALR